MSVSSRGHHHILFFFQKSLRQLFWSSFLRQSGFALVDIFTFLYFFRLGMSQHWFAFLVTNHIQQGILTVVADVLILRLIELIVIIPLTQVASRLGLPRAAILGNFLMALRYGILAVSTQYPLLVFSAAIVQGIEISVFGPAYDTMFAKRASSSKVGRDVGAFTFILKLSNALLPALAGGMIVFAGFYSAFLSTMTLLLLSNIPLLAMQWREPLTYPTIKHFYRWLKAEANPKILISFVGRYISDATFELWPIYLFLVIGRIERIGVLMSFALFASLILIYFSGWFVDHSKKNTPFIVGGVLLSLFWILRINISLISMIIALEVAQKIVESFFYPSYDAYIYRISKRLDTFAFHVYRELMTCITSLVFWSLLGCLFIMYGMVWNWVFILAAVGILLSTLLYAI